MHLVAPQGRKLKWDPENPADRLYSLPAVWLREILADSAEVEVLGDLKAGPFSPRAALPARRPRSTIDAMTHTSSTIDLTALRASFAGEILTGTGLPSPLRTSADFRWRRP